MIELVHFSKKYSIAPFKTFAAASDINLVAKKGRITGLLGPNGAGKTTVIKAICALHYPTSGKVLVHADSGEVLDTVNDSVKVKAITGYVTERPVLYEDFTVREFLAAADLVSGRIVKKTTEQLEKKAAASSDFEKVVEMCSLSDVLSKKIKSLSNGYYQRVNLAQALIRKPEILVLDEPASGLDPAQIKEMHSIIKKLSSEKTILFSTHILSEAEKLCDDIYIIAEGKLLAGGSKEEIKKSLNAKSLEDAYMKAVSK